MVPITLQPPLHRPRERLRHQGIATLSLEDTLCLILGSGNAASDVRSLARSLLPLLYRAECSLNDLLAIPGIGLARAASVLAALHLPAKIEQNNGAYQALTNPDHLYKACQDLVVHHQEHLVVFYLSSRSTVIERELISIGTATASLIHPREVFRAAIHHNAVAIALAHNHPSGSTDPSGADCTVTQEVAHAGHIVGIELVDHLICSQHGFTSLKMAQPHLFCYPKNI
jgi:DNA repair protein RadC